MLTQHVKFVNLSNMTSEDKHVSVAAIGKDLMVHAKTFEIDGNKRGLVAELYPAIFMASERMSARGISRFLKEKHGISLSAVTIAKALNDPKKYWNLFFDTIEPSLVAYEKVEPNERREKYLYDDKAFEKLEFPGREKVRKFLLKYEFARAMDDLREKWFTIDFAIRLKARPYLAERFIGKMK